MPIDRSTIFTPKDQEELEYSQEVRQVIVKSLLKRRKGDNVDIEEDKVILQAMRDFSKTRLDIVKVSVSKAQVDKQDETNALLSQVLRSVDHVMPETKSSKKKKKTQHAIPKDLDVKLKSIPGENRQLDEVDSSVYHPEEES